MSNPHAGLLAYDLRAGADWLQRPENAVARRYFIKVRAAGSWAAYEKLHRASLVAMFVPIFSRVLPAQPARLVVELEFPHENWEHIGHGPGRPVGYASNAQNKGLPNSEFTLVVRRCHLFADSGPGTYPHASRNTPPRGDIRG